MRTRPGKKAAAAAQVGTGQKKVKENKDGGSDNKIGKATAEEEKLKAQEIREEAEEIESGSGSGSDYDEEEQESGSGSGSDNEEEEISSGGSDSDSEEESDSVYDSGEGEEYESGSDDEEFPKIDRSDVLEDEDDGEGSEAEQVEEESDSSEDEVAPRNTIGDVPFEWYEDEEHVGYDISGTKIRKSERQNKLDSFLQNKDDSKNWLKVHDAYNDEVVDLSKDEYKMLRRIMKGQAPHANFDPYPDYVDWFKWDDAKHPLSNAPEPKRRFTPSKWEAKKVVKLIRAIRKGFIKVDEPKEEPHFYNLWEDDSSSASTKHLSYIPPPKPKLPGHDESYNPSLEYIPTQEEINSYQLMDEEDRPKFIPTRFTSLRSIPAYENVKDSFERCLDLYLCPRVRKKRLNIDPESLKPKLPSRKDLKPYPTTCYIEYRGHKGAVMSISTESSGQWIASGSMDGTVRVWEVETGRCLRVWEFGEAVQCVAWNPMVELPILAVSVGQDVFLLNTGLGNGEIQKGVQELLCVKPIARENSDDKANAVSWLQDEKHGGIRLTHFKTVSSVQWHRRGDYFSVVIPAGQSRSILIHKLSKNHTLTPGWKLHGLAVSSAFHPTRSIFFVATKNHVRIYNLLKEDRDKMLMKKLETGLREVSSISVHPGGDNLIVGSKEGKLCWFDVDLSSKPYKVINCHPKDITNVAFHRSYPLFASCSDDCTAYVFHGMVPADLNENPVIVPLEILRGHTSSNGRGIMDCKFHPRQPWLFTAGADSLIKLYCH